MRKVLYISIFLLISLVSNMWGQEMQEFDFTGIWGDNGYNPQLHSVPEFLSISKLDNIRFLVLWNVYRKKTVNYRTLATLKAPNKLAVTFNNLEWTIEGIRDYENGKLVYEGLVMYVDPSDEGVIGFDRVETIDPRYLVPEADR